MGQKKEHNGFESEACRPDQGYRAGNWAPQDPPWSLGTSMPGHCHCRLCIGVSLLYSLIKSATSKLRPPQLVCASAASPVRSLSFKFHSQTHGGGWDPTCFALRPSLQDLTPKKLYGLLSCHHCIPASYWRCFKETRFSGRCGKVQVSFPSGPLHCVQFCPRSRACKSECKNSKAESPKKGPLVLVISWAKSDTWHRNKGPVCEQQGPAPRAALGRQCAGLAPPLRLGSPPQLGLWMRQASLSSPSPLGSLEEPKGQMETNEHLAAAGNFPFCSGGHRKEGWVSRDSKFGNVYSTEHRSLPLVLWMALTPFLDSCCVPSASVCKAGGEGLANRGDRWTPSTNISCLLCTGIAPGLGAQRSSDRPSQTLHPRPGFSSISHLENLLEHRSWGASLPPSTPTPSFWLGLSEVGPENLHL